MGNDNDTPIDNDAATVLKKIFVVKTFANCPETAKFAKVFTRERLPLYGITLNVRKLTGKYGYVPL